MLVEVEVVLVEVEVAEVEVDVVLVEVVLGVVAVLGLTKAISNAVMAAARRRTATEVRNAHRGEH